MSTALTSSQRSETLDSSDDSRQILIGTPSPSSNSIRTSKYTLLTFLPRNLFEQFHRLAYLYFLIIAVLNQLPQVAVFGRGASLLPLSFVLLVTALKDAFEDRRRHLSDTLENNRPATLLKSSSTAHHASTDIKSKNPYHTVPADVKNITANSNCTHSSIIVDDPSTDFIYKNSINTQASSDTIIAAGDPDTKSKNIKTNSDGQFVNIKSKNIRVGDVIRVCSNETIPADIVLLSTSEASGVCYVQTINLDGESNLKTRYAKQETIGKFPDFSGMVVRCERPNRNIYGFQAYLEVEGRRVSLGPSNILLRGCQVKNTEWVVGVVVYTGSETKVMMNSSGAPSKRSRLETHMNRETLFLSAILLVQCLVVCILNGVWLVQHEDELELDQFFRQKDYSSGSDKNYNYYGVPMTVFIIFLMAVIVFQTMIPISLYISMELVRVGQAYFMGRDSGLYDENSNSRFQCRALNINEDLGQIKYVFSDKTGTLTENKMVFQCACIGGVDYGAMKASFLDESNNYSVVVGNQIWRPKLSLKTNPELVKLLRSESTTEEVIRSREFFLALAACNTIVPLVVDTPDPNQKLIDYQGESPDEQALVYAAAAYGFILIERTSGHISIDVLGDRQRFEVLGLHEFDSDRKRMSVIIGCPDKTVKLFVKGADSSMLAVLDRNVDSDIVRATQQNLHTYSSLGLRTLVIGMRELNRNEFVEWQSAYERASTALLGRASLLRNVAAEIESNLRILGASAIEDKLQQGVPEAIESLRQAAIKVWVLTGDKQETAISIGYSCKLLTNEMEQIVINSNSRDSCKKSLQDAVTGFSTLAGSSLEAQSNIVSTGTTNVQLALIIDGTSLVYILETELEEELFKIATVCDVVLCCRVAPLQKAGIVALIKNRTDDMTLAIGDGANDVSMIQMADVGIGISGQEGRQAVMASDFAMGQFRFLVPLLLVHGHWNYQRMAYMILYNFYRNSTFVFVLFWYVLYTAFTLTTAITEWSSVLYSVIYTSVPTIAVGILDKDLSRRTLLKYPQLYASGQKEEKYNLMLFILTMMDSVWQSLVVFYIPYLAYRHSTIDGSSLGDLWTLAVVILVNIHLAMDVLHWTWITHASVWGSIIATAISVFVIDAIWALPGYWAIFHIMGTVEFWLCILSIVIVGMVPRFAFKSLFEHVTPNDIHRAREVEKFGNSRSASTSEIPMRTILQSER